MIDAASLSFRYMTDADLPIVLKNERSSYSFPWTEGVLRECLGGISECWVAVLEGEIIGHGITSHVLDEGHLLNLCIGRPWQGRGYAHLFLEFLMQRLRELEIKMVFLEVRLSNEVAISLYQKHGFAKIGLRKGYYPAGDSREDAIVMSRNIGAELARA